MRTTTTALMVAAGLLAASTAHAQEVEVYGQAHLAFSYLDDGADYSAANLSSNGSRIGFRVGHDFTPAVRGMVQIEGQVNFDNNGAERFTSRNSFAGLQGDWGLLRAGRFDTPNKILRTRTDLFGNQVGDSRNVIRGNYDGNQGFDERFRKGVAYRTPTVSGFFADAHYSVETAEDTNSVDGNENDAWSASITYRQGPVYAAVSHEQWNYSDAMAGGSRVYPQERDVTRAAAYVDIASFRITGLAQTASDPDDNAYGGGVRYTVVPDVHLKAQYYLLDADDSDYDADLVAVGVDYQYADNLGFYANYSQIDNEAAQNRQPWVQASTLDRTSAVGETASAFAVGTVYKF
ncbi:porin [Aquisalimonas lutea]|uniref:porin n=1 Tax=Aquisalimonas lutea TaxID=1327750 RepID=UPI0025B6270B|nr:porin [Aquisalimonas lutea]MDN3519522.1 porin [Aquisalimonas lutea]